MVKKNKNTSFEFSSTTTFRSLIHMFFSSSFTSLHSFAFVGWNQILFKMFTFQIRPRSCMTNALLICAPPSEAITCRCKVLFLFFIFDSVILISGCLILIFDSLILIFGCLILIFGCLILIFGCLIVFLLKPLEI